MMALFETESVTFLVKINGFLTAYRPFAPVCGTPLRKKQLDAFWQKINIVRKKGKFNFKISRIG
jgi:hypothetical protein